MELLVALAQELLDEVVDKAVEEETKERGKENQKESLSRKARTSARKANTKARWTPSSASYALSTGTGHVNVQTGWFNKLFKVILLNFHRYQSNNNLLAKEFNLRLDNLPNPVILLPQHQRCEESSRFLWVCLFCQVLQVLLQFEW